MAAECGQTWWQVSNRIHVQRFFKSAEAKNKKVAVCRIGQQILDVGGIGALSGEFDRMNNGVNPHFFT